LPLDGWTFCVLFASISIPINMFLKLIKEENCPFCKKKVYQQVFDDLSPRGEEERVGLKRRRSFEASGLAASHQDNQVFEQL
jgi:hypothetical protein